MENLNLEKNESGTWFLSVFHDNGGHGIPLSETDYEELKQHFIPEAHRLGNALLLARHFIMKVKDNWGEGEEDIYKTKILPAIQEYEAH